MDDRSSLWHGYPVAGTGEETSDTGSCSCMLVLVLSALCLSCIDGFVIGSIMAISQKSELVLEGQMSR